MIIILFATIQPIVPIGIYKYVQYDFLFTGVLRYLILLVLMVVSIMYLLEKRMTFTLFIMSILSVLLITYHESSGVYNRDTIFSAILIAQFIAYFIKQYFTDYNYRKFRFLFSIQIVAANYFLAGYSKLEASGLSWVTDGDKFLLQILKGFYFRYFDTGQEMFKQIAWDRLEWFLDYPWLITILLGIALFLEVFSWIALIGRKFRIFMGLMLVGMHLGIYLTMDIIIEAVIACMVIFYLNPLYYILILVREVYNKVVFFIKVK